MHICIYEYVYIMMCTSLECEVRDVCAYCAVKVGLGRGGRVGVQFIVNCMSLRELGCTYVYMWMYMYVRACVCECM